MMIKAILNRVLQLYKLNQHASLSAPVLLKETKISRPAFFLLFLFNLYFPAGFSQHKEGSQPYSSDLAARLSTTHLHVFFHLTHTYTLKRNFPLILPETHFSSCSSHLFWLFLFLHLHSLHIKESRSVFSVRDAWATVVLQTANASGDAIKTQHCGLGFFFGSLFWQRVFTSTSSHILVFNLFIWSIHISF